ncbi:hypothetical protein [Streptomyces sp. XH2]
MVPGNIRKRADKLTKQQQADKLTEQRRADLDTLGMRWSATTAARSKK